MRDRIHVSEDRSDRMLNVFEDYKAFRNRDPKLTANKIRIIVETSNKDVDTANRFVQSDRKARGELRSDGFLVTDTEQDRSWLLHETDSIIFLRSYMIDKHTEPVRNGTRGKITKIDQRRQEAIVELEDDRKVTIRLKDHEHSQPMGLAYSQHANKIQGDEVPIVQVMPGTEHTANANSAYSQLTRAQEEAHVYLDRETHGDMPEETLADSWASRVDKRTALSRTRERTEAHEQTAEERVPNQEAPACARWPA